MAFYCEACRRLPDRLASVLNLARSQTLQAGMAGRACCLGNLRTLATAYQANFSKHLVPVLVSGSTRHLELPAITLTRWEFPETLGNRCTDCSRGNRPRLHLQCAEWRASDWGIWRDGKVAGSASSSLPVDRIVTRKPYYLGRYRATCCTVSNAPGFDCENLPR